MPSRIRRPLVAALCALSAVFLVPASASAHADLDFSLPTAGASVGEPVSEITVGFTETVTLVGNGFEVLDPQGNLIEPFAVTDDDQVFRLQLDPALGGGEVGVAYKVTSADGHVVEGTFSFTVSVPAPTTTTTTTTTTTPTTTVSTATTSVPTTTAPAASTTTVTNPATTSSTADSTTTAVAPDEGSGDGSGSTWIYLLIGGAVVIGAGAFLLFRKNPSG